MILHVQWSLFELDLGIVTENKNTAAAKAKKAKLKNSLQKGQLMTAAGKNK